MGTPHGPGTVGISMAAGRPMPLPRHDRCPRTEWEGWWIIDGGLIDVDSIGLFREESVFEERRFCLSVTVNLSVSIF